MALIKKPPFRFWIAVMIFFSTFQNYMLRSNISVSIVAMNSPPPKNTTSNVTELSPCQKEAGDQPKLKNQTKSTEFHWAEQQSAQILGGYFMGYLSTVLIGGPVAEWIGPWHVIFWTSVGCTFMTALSPVSARAGHGWLVANRVIIGMLGGPVYPAINVIIAKWAPPQEKGKFLSAMMGNTIGTVFTWITVGLFSDQFGWDWGFYVLVFAMVAYLVAFFFLVADSPDKSRWISAEERDHIFECQEGHVSKKKAKPPLLRIFTSYRFWAMVSAQMGNLWGLNLILTYLPKYNKEVLGFDLKSSAAIAALPYLCRMFMSVGFGVAGDYMRKKHYMKLTNLRKFFMIFSHGIPAFCFFLIYPSGCAYIAVVALLILNMGFNGAVVVSHLVNPQDLAPNFAGTLYGIMNFCAMTTGIFVPPITAAILNAEKNISTAGAYVFSLGAIAEIFFGLVFVVFGSAEVQPWNEVKQDEPAGEPGTAKQD